MVITVYEKDTRELLALIVKDGQCACRNDVEFTVFEDDTEPTFLEIDGKVYLNGVCNGTVDTERNTKNIGAD